jgi:hypothetical protein
MKLSSYISSKKRSETQIKSGHHISVAFPNATLKRSIILQSQKGDSDTGNWLVGIMILHPNKRIWRLRDVSWYTFHLEARGGSLATIRPLVNLGIDVNRVDDREAAPLYAQP